MLLLVSNAGICYAAPTPPLNIEQFKTLIAQADLIIIGKVNEVKETEGTVEAAVYVEKLLKGKVAEKTIEIEETYKAANSQEPSLGSKDEGESSEAIVRSIAGPSAYHGKYNKGSRIVMFLEKIEGTNKYRPLGSGTYDKHLCEFLIENDSIKTYYFQFAEDVGKYAVSEKAFINFIKKS